MSYYYTNRPCQHVAGDKDRRPNNFSNSCVIYAYILLKICMTYGTNKKSPKSNNITSYVAQCTYIFKSVTWTVRILVHIAQKNWKQGNCGFGHILLKKSLMENFTFCALPVIFRISWIKSYQIVNINIYKI